MQESPEELGKRKSVGGGRGVESGAKKWGLVIARFAIRSPVPRSALFLK
jgi:hypothetical protein